MREPTITWRNPSITLSCLLEFVRCCDDLESWPRLSFGRVIWSLPRPMGKSVAPRELSICALGSVDCWGCSCGGPGALCRRIRLRRSYLFRSDRRISGNAVEVQVSRLRKTLCRIEAGSVVETVRGVGYVLKPGPPICRKVCNESGTNGKIASISRSQAQESETAA